MADFYQRRRGMVRPPRSPLPAPVPAFSSLGSGGPLDSLVNRREPGRVRGEGY